MAVRSGGVRYGVVAPDEGFAWPGRAGLGVHRAVVLKGGSSEACGVVLGGGDACCGSLGCALLARRHLGTVVLGVVRGDLERLAHGAKAIGQAQRSEREPLSRATQSRRGCPASPGPARPGSLVVLRRRREARLEANSLSRTPR